MNLGRIFANAVARRIVYVLVVLLLAAFGVGRAHAITSSEAMALCPPYRLATFGEGPRASSCYTHGGTEDHPTTECRNNTELSRIQLVQECDDGFVDVLKTWVYDNNCAAQPPVTGVLVAGDAPTICSSGCAYARQGAAPETTCLNGDCSSPNTVAFGATYAPTGANCVADAVMPEPSSEDYCRDVGGGYQQCATTNGQTCIVSSTGTRFCWEHGEAGANVAGNEAASKGPAPGPPSTPPPNDENGEPQQWAQDHSSGVIESGTPNTINNYESTSGGNPDPGGGDGGGEDSQGIIDAVDSNTDSTGGKLDELVEQGTGASGGEGCTVPPVCPAGVIACAQLEQQWRAACAGENVGEFLDGTEGADDDGSAGVEPGDAFAEDDPEDPGSFDESGWIGGSRTCPNIPTVQVFDATLDLNNPDICWFLSIAGHLVLISAAIAGIGILGRAI